LEGSSGWGLRAPGVEGEGECGLGLEIVQMFAKCKDVKEVVWDEGYGVFIESSLIEEVKKREEKVEVAVEKEVLLDSVSEQVHFVDCMEKEDEELKEYHY
jgi:hypothetical protein